MQTIINTLAEHQLLLLFVVLSIGYAVGRINIFGIKLGAAAVLFVGLFISALSPEIKLPSLITSLGLVLFVYSIGIASGSSFFNSFKRYGIKDMLVVLAFLGLAGLVAIIASKVTGIDGAIVAGTYTGALTNTPALASAIDLLETGNFSDINIEPTTPTIGYSIAYPLGVILPILAIFFWQRRFKIKYDKDILKAKGLVKVGADLVNQSIVVTNKEMIGKTIKDIRKQYGWQIVFGRIKRGQELLIVDSSDIALQKNDIISVIGEQDQIKAVHKAIGDYSSSSLQFEPSDYIYRRVFVSEKKIIGKTIKELKLPQKYGAIVTRIRRGDQDMLADPNHVLEYGDRVRFITPKQHEYTIAKVFGDSYKSISDIHPMSIGIGITLGLLLGMIPIKLPGGIVFTLGDAGGPLIVGLFLSYLRRSGPFVWSISYSANHTIRELGLSLMLAGIGIRSGQTFVNGLQDGSGMQILLIGGLISFIVPMLFIPFAYKKLKLPFGIVSGMISAIHTQPAVISYANQQAKNDLPTYGYVRLFPLATIFKIIIAQLLVLGLV
jgi:putative transport protein